MVAARSIINKGCEVCPTNEDVWLEAARLHIPKNAKVGYLPNLQVFTHFLCSPLVCRPSWPKQSSICRPASRFGCAPAIWRKKSNLRRFVHRSPTVHIALPLSISLISLPLFRSSFLRCCCLPIVVLDFFFLGLVRSFLCRTRVAASLFGLFVLLSLASDPLEPHTGCVASCA